jgi:type I site-specific restriction endonuclease
MPTPFDVELIYSYLEAINLPIDYNIDYIQNSYVGQGISQKIDLIADNILDSINNTAEDPDDNEQKQRELREAYDAIVSVHFEYVYGRVWEYKLDGELLPEDLSDRFKNILSLETDFLDLVKSTDNELIHDLIQNADAEKIRYLNSQTLARIFVHYYENPHNWGFY